MEENHERNSNAGWPWEKRKNNGFYKLTEKITTEMKAEILWVSGKNGRKTIDGEYLQVHLRTQGYNEVSKSQVKSDVIEMDFLQMSTTAERSIDAELTKSRHLNRDHENVSPIEIIWGQKKTGINRMKSWREEVFISM